MTTPSKTDLISAGYRMTANATDAVVTRCATEVLNSYILAFVETSDVSNATTSDAIGQAWLALTFLRFLQDTEFGTRTGGEKKRFEYGEHLTWMNSIKNTCAQRIDALEDAATVDDGEMRDICGVYFRTQLFH